jgi:NAD(P)-dependent dehydrogenase (short-subunit alcohol dehydrogenase family)
VTGLAGLRVLVTGASGGIGSRVVERLHAEGCVVAATDIAVPEIAGVAYAAAADITDEDSVASMVAAAQGSLGGVDALVAVAGIQVTGPTHEVSAADFRKVLEVSVMGTFLVARAVVPAMLRAGAGRIVTFGSTAALVAAPELAAYAAAKGAVLQFTRSIAAEYARRGIRANCICPGGTMTPLLAEIDRHRTGPDHFREGHPIGRYADPGEIAAAVAFLLSDDSSFVLGSAFMVDGGYTCV